MKSESQRSATDLLVLWFLFSWIAIITDF
jgi:hypothetical protein